MAEQWQQHLPKMNLATASSEDEFFRDYRSDNFPHQAPRKEGI
jgi:hypothetical protein